MISQELAEFGDRIRVYSGEKDVGVVSGELCPFFVRQQVSLVQDCDRGDVVESQIAQDGLDGKDLVGEVRVGGVDHVQQEVRFLKFFQGGSKGPGQFVGEFSDEPDRIVEDGVFVVAQEQSAAGRIEGREKSVFSQNVASRERIQESGLPGVGVSDQAHDR